MIHQIKTMMVKTIRRLEKEECNNSHKNKTNSIEF